MFLAAWALVPLVFFSLSQSKLPGYYLPALPAIALASGVLLAHALKDEDLARTALAQARVTAWIVLVLGIALVPVAASVGPHLPTALQRQELPRFALDFGILLVAVALIAMAAISRRNILAVSAALALPVIATPVAGRALFDAIAQGRSSKGLAGAIDRVAPHARVVGANAYPTALRYYMDRAVLLSSGTGSELTSNYVMSRLAEFRALEDSPLRPGGWWQVAEMECDTPTVFVAHIRTREDTLLAVSLPLIGRGGADEKFAAYGPCSPPVHAAAPALPPSHPPTH